jgi:predicted nucleotidyltransferase
MLGEELTKLVHELKFRLAGHCLGIILFGSHARGHPTCSSDIDLLLVLSDVEYWESERIAREVEARLAYPARVTLNVDSWSRLRQFAAIGDPFVLAVIKDGKMLVGDPQWFEALQAECIAKKWVKEDVVGHLRAKADFHQQALLRKLHEVASEIQLWLMAKTGAIACATREMLISGDGIYELSTWPAIASDMASAGLDESVVGLMKDLIFLHKDLVGVLDPDTDRIDIGLQKLSSLLERWAQSRVERIER